MIKLMEMLSEVPIDNLSTIGDFSKGSSFTSKADRALVTHPVAVNKIKDFFKNISVDFDFYFVNTKDARKFTEIGKVDEDFVFDKLKINPEQLKNGKIDRNVITVFFTNNKGAEKMPLTAWVIAHRFGHVLARRNVGGVGYAWREFVDFMTSKVDELLSLYGKPPIKMPSYYGDESGYKSAVKYDLYRKNVAQLIGTFKSARDKNLRNFNEFMFEIFAEYLSKGSIRLNQLPPTIQIGSEAYGRPVLARSKNPHEVQMILDDIKGDFGYYAENVLSDAVGNIYVM